MEVVGDNWTTGAISRAKLQSNHHHQQTNIQFVLQPRCPACRPNQQCPKRKYVQKRLMDAYYFFLLKHLRNAGARLIFYCEIDFGQKDQS